MTNIIGIKFLNENQYGSRKTYYFRNNTDYTFKKGDKVIVLNYRGQEEIVEVYNPSILSHPRIPNEQMKSIVGVYVPVNRPAATKINSTTLPNI